MPDHGVAALELVVVGILGSKHGNVCLERLRQEPVCSLAQDRGSGVRSGRLWMGKGHRRMLLHGVSTPAV
jgi:hypothetical protein